ncbi:MAG: ABC transporter substrate-binding protein [Planctomycetota bacterium]
MPLRFRVPALLLLGLLLLLPGPSSLQAGPTDEPQVLRYNENGSPLLDPARYAANRMNDERLLIAVLEPLTSLDPETGTAKAGAATSWSQGEDGVTWTFKLRPTAKWSDGSPVTSADFVRSWKRTLDRSKVAEQASPWVELLFVLDGCREMIANAARVELFSELRKALDEEIERNTATGIPGDRLNDLLTDLGVRPYLVGVKGRAIVRLANWDSKQSLPGRGRQERRRGLEGGPPRRQERRQRGAGQVRQEGLARLRTGRPHPRAADGRRRSLPARPRGARRVRARPRALREHPRQDVRGRAPVHQQRPVPFRGTRPAASLQHAQRAYGQPWCT